MKINRRVRGIILKDKKILLIKRIKNGEEYFIIPGGGVEPGETEEEALVREIMEETNQNVLRHSKLFEYEPDEHKDDEQKLLTFFLVHEFKENELIMTGPEIERMREDNQYIPGWYDFIEFARCPRDEDQRKMVKKITQLLGDKISN